jgi:hypothetical protein
MIHARGKSSEKVR